MAKIQRVHPFPKSLYRKFREAYGNKSREVLRTYTHLANIYGEYYYDMVEKKLKGDSASSQLAPRYQSSVAFLLKAIKKSDPLTYNVVRKSSIKWGKLLKEVDAVVNDFLDSGSSPFSGPNSILRKTENPDEVYEKTLPLFKAAIKPIFQKEKRYLETFFLPVILKLLEKADVFIKTPPQLVAKPRMGFPFFRLKLMRAKEETIERASETTRQSILQSKEALQLVRSEILSKLQAEGVDVELVYMGRSRQPFYEAKDPKGDTYYIDLLTGEAIRGDEPGKAKEALFEHLDNKRKQSQMADTIWPKGHIEGLPRLNQTTLDEKTYGKEIYRSLSDDATSRSITRVLPTKKIKINGQERIVVMSGRFKGYFLDDLVNSSGRMLEGTSHYLDSNGKRSSIENIDKQGRLILGEDFQKTGLKEPYMTMGRDGKLVLGLPTLRQVSLPTMNKALATLGLDPKKFKAPTLINTKGEFYLGKKDRESGKQPLSRKWVTEHVKILEAKENPTKEETAALEALINYLDATAEKMKRWRLKRLLKNVNPVKPWGQMYPAKRERGPDGKLKTKKGSGSTALWQIDPQDFEAVQGILGGIALSNGAATEVEDFYRDQLRKDDALEEENLQNYSPEEIGGFKETFFDKPFQFNNKQKEGLAWLDVSGYQGVMALDTGVGKTLVSIAAAQKMLSEGYSSEDCPSGEAFDALSEDEQNEAWERAPKSCKFLYVCPTALVGNITQDIMKFMETGPGANLNHRFDQISYKEFTKKRENPKWGEDYIAIFFDEAHYLKGTGKTVRAAATLDHPRKVMLTASAIDKDPSDLFTITAITNNIDPSTPEYRAKKRAFERRFAQKVGGRFVGINRDPLVQRQFFQWVKANAFFAPKTQVDYTEAGLPPLPELEQPDAVTVQMNPRVAREYEKTAKEVIKELRVAIKRYRDAQFDSRDVDVKDFAKNKYLRGAMKKLSQLSIDPSSVKGPNGKPMFPDMKNPKIEQGVQITKEKLKEGKRLLFWTDNNKVAKANVKKLSTDGGPSSIHVLGLSTSLEFWQDGKRLKRVTAKTSGNDPLGMWAGAEAIKKQIQKAQKDLEENPRRTSLQGRIEKLQKELRRVTRLEKRLGDKGLSRILKSAANPVGNEWAVQALKKYVKTNPLVATCTLTSNYTTGVNLQTFDTVVHLDRNQFSSEAMKQRTGRAWRAGAKHPVEEVILDAVVPDRIKKDPDMLSLDQIRELIQNADEEFISEIVKSTQEVGFSDAYKSMEKENTKSLAISRRLLELQLAPTPENEGEILAEIADIEANPVKYISPRPDRYAEVDLSVDEETLSTVKDSLGSDVSVEEIADLCGASSMSNLEEINITSRRDAMGRGILNIVAKGPLIKRVERQVVLPVGKPDSPDYVPGYISNLSFSVEDPICGPKGVAVRNLALQISSAKKLGIERFVTYAAGSSAEVAQREGRIQKYMDETESNQVEAERATEVGYVGYSVWPNFGYSAKLNSRLEAKARIEIPQVIKDLERKEGLSSPFQIRDLYLYPTGKEWWKNNGEDFAGDLSTSSGSEGLEIFQKYLMKKVKDSGMTLEGYINSAPPPPEYDVDNPECVEERALKVAGDYLEDIDRKSVRKVIQRHVRKKAAPTQSGGSRDVEMAPRIDEADEAIFAQIFEQLRLNLRNQELRKQLEERLNEAGE